LNYTREEIEIVDFGFSIASRERSLPGNDVIGIGKLSISIVSRLLVFTKRPTDDALTYGI